MTQNVLAFPRLGMLDQAQCQAIHLASLEILRRTGTRVHCEEALALLRETDAVITDGNLVRFPPGLIEWALAQAPPRVTLCRRGSDQGLVPLQGRVVNFGPGSDCPNYLDPRTGEHRPFKVADVIDAIHVVDALPEMDFCMSMGIPSDLGGQCQGSLSKGEVLSLSKGEVLSLSKGEVLSLSKGKGSPYRHQFALMLAHTAKPLVFVCDDLADCQAIVAMATAAAGGRDALRLNPTLLLYSEPSTPLQHSQTATEKLLYMAEQGLPIVHSPAPMMGGTAPVTLAGGVALGNAEVLSSLVMHQLKRPGAPFVYGVQAHHLDMKTTISAYGAPEYELARVMTAELGRFYGMPTWGNAGMSDSCALDEQAAADATFAVLVAFLTGTNLVHDVGYLEAGLTTSPEMIVLTAELISMIRRFVGGVRLDAESLALEVIHQVGPGGDFMSTDHTLKHFREMWQPALFSRQRMGEWVNQGRQRLGDRLREKTVALLKAHVPESLPDNVREEIAYILAQ